MSYAITRHAHKIKNSVPRTQLSFEVVDPMHKLQFVFLYHKSCVVDTNCAQLDEAIAIRDDFPFLISI